MEQQQQRAVPSRAIQKKRKLISKFKATWLSWEAKDVHLAPKLVAFVSNDAFITDWLPYFAVSQIFWKGKKCNRWKRGNSNELKCIYLKKKKSYSSVNSTLK